MLERLGVIARDGERAIDLGSFRPGGATHLLQLSEDSELVRRRGRWASHRVMEIYLQEIQAIVSLPNQPEHVRRRILFFAQAFGPLQHGKRGASLPQPDFEGLEQGSSVRTSARQNGSASRKLGTGPSPG